jgi:hypothetical protein
MTRSRQIRVRATVWQFPAAVRVLVQQAPIGPQCLSHSPRSRGNIISDRRPRLARFGKAELVLVAFAPLWDNEHALASCGAMTRTKAKASSIVMAISSRYFVDGAGVSIRGSISARVAAF